MSTCRIYLFSYLFNLCLKLEKQNSQTPKSHCFCCFSSSDGRKQKIWQSLSEPLELEVRTLWVCLSYGQGTARAFRPLLCFMSQREAGEGAGMSSQLTLDFSNTQGALRTHMKKQEKLLMMRNKQNTDDFCFTLSANVDHSAIAGTL